MSTAIIPVPRVPVGVRVATIEDVAFIDSLQKLHSRMVGFMPTKQIEGKIAAGNVLVAEESDEATEARSDEGVGIAASYPCVASSLRRSTPSPIGYVISTDRYFKHDDVGIIYQLNVAPGNQRAFVGATLLKAVFERAAWGCKLFCCWCAQDIAANRFWEAMGFVPLAYRAGSRNGRATKGRKGADLAAARDRDEATEGKAATAPAPFVASSLRRSTPSPRVHIFWQKRIRAGDVTTPWWFPSQTTGGAIREDRLVLPIPPGTHWSDAKPLILPGGPLALEDRSATAAKPKARAAAAPERQRTRASVGGLWFTPPPPPAAPAPASGELAQPKSKKPKAKNDPRLVAAARELRDRWLEHVNAGGDATSMLSHAKYEVSRAAGPARIDAARPPLLAPSHAEAA